MLGSLGWEELLIILVIIALLFGAGRVADMGGALGRGIREFRSAASGDEDEKKSAAVSNVAAPSLFAGTDATALASQVDALKALAALHEHGIVTDEEFEMKKSEIVARM